MSKITIRCAQPEERPRFADLFGPSLPWTDPAHLRAALADSSRTYMVAEVGGEIVAIGGYGPSHYTRRAVGLGPAATLPAARGLGAGTAIVMARPQRIEIEAAAKGMTEIGVHVASKRPEFWHRQGFQTAAVVDGVPLLCAVRSVPMTLDRAKEINTRIVRAFMAVDMGYPASTDLSDITMEEAAVATDIMQSHPGDRNEDGTKTIHCVLDERCLSKLARFMAPVASRMAGQGAAA